MGWLVSAHPYERVGTVFRQWGLREATITRLVRSLFRYSTLPKSRGAPPSQYRSLAGHEEHLHHRICLHLSGQTCYIAFTRVATLMFLRTIRWVLRDNTAWTIRHAYHWQNFPFTCYERIHLQDKPPVVILGSSLKI